MQTRTSKPIVHLARVVRSALLELMYFRGQCINVFSLKEIVLDVATYLKKEALVTIKVLITASSISFEWAILTMIFDPMPAPITNIHLEIIQMLLVSSSFISVAKCILNISESNWRSK